MFFKTIFWKLVLKLLLVTSIKVLYLYCFTKALVISSQDLRVDLSIYTNNCRTTLLWVLGKIWVIYFWVSVIKPTFKENNDRWVLRQLVPTYLSISDILNFSFPKKIKKKIRIGDIIPRFKGRFINLYKQSPNNPIMSSRKDLGHLLLSKRHKTYIWEKQR